MPGADAGPLTVNPDRQSVATPGVSFGQVGEDPSLWQDAEDVGDDGEWRDAEPGPVSGRPESADRSDRVESSSRKKVPAAHEPVSRGTEVPDPDADVSENPVLSHKPLGVRRIGRHWGRFAELWVPETLRDARVDPGRRGALILLLVAALAAAVTAAGVWRDRPEPRAVETSAIAALAGAPAPAETGTAAGTANTGAVGAEMSGTNAPGLASSTSISAPSEIVVSVTGLVGRPGLVTLPAGARVADAIAAAGGASSDADLTGVNLAARLSDSDSVVVASTPAPGNVASAVTRGDGKSSATTDNGAAGSGLVDLNTADEAALDALPGVGPVMAQNILGWREANGKFTSIEQLQEISGIGQSRYAQISPLVTVS